jgi:hypothetical protein
LVGDPVATLDHRHSTVATESIEYGDICIAVDNKLKQKFEF